MLGILGGDERCPIARSLDVLGEKWSLMLVRDAMLGVTRFNDFRERLGIPREVLTARLGSLVEAGVLERVSYKPDGGRSREEYVLTDAGRDLAPVLLALGAWADRYRPSTERAEFRIIDSKSGQSVAPAAVIAGTTRIVDPQQLTMTTI